MLPQIPQGEFPGQSLTIELSVVDEETVKACDNILFNNIYREAIEMGLCYKVALGLSLDKETAKYLALYEKQIALRRGNLKSHASVACYRDGF